MQDVFRRTAIKAISSRLTASIAAANDQSARQTDELFKEQAELNHRQQELSQGLQAVQVNPRALFWLVLGMLC